MVLVAFVIRIVVMAFLYPRDFNPQFDHWFFGFEEGRVARAIAQGHGFSNPLWGPSGPTAWYAPIYPYLLAADFKLFGVFTKSACIAILVFQALVSSLTCLPIFFFARRSFSEGAALAAGWVWVVYPYAVYWPVIRIWETWFATLLLAILFYIILKLERSSKISYWIGFGVLSGFTALTDPAVLSVLPVLALWALWRLYRRVRVARDSFIKANADSLLAKDGARGMTFTGGREVARLFACGVCCVLAVILVISPWIIRNYKVFHKFIPIRDNLALEFRVGNSGKTLETMDLLAGPWLPWVNNTEWNEYRRMGEIAYFHQKGEQAKAYIEAHPLWYVGMTARRIVFVWTGFWRADKRYIDNETYDPAAITLLTLLTALTFMGLARAYRKKGASVATPYAIVLFFFPLIYYLTHVERWYRCPMGPMIIALAAYEVHARAAEYLRRRKSAKGFDLPALADENSEEIPAAPLP